RGGRGSCSIAPPRWGGAPRRPCPISRLFPSPAKQLAERSRARPSQPCDRLPLPTSGIPRMTPKLTQRFSGLAARLTRGVDGYQQLGSPNDGRGADLAIFTGIWTHSRLLLNA